MYVRVLFGMQHANVRQIGAILKTLQQQIFCHLQTQQMSRHSKQNLRQNHLLVKLVLEIHSNMHITSLVFS